MWTDFNNSFTFGFVDKLRNTVKKSSTAPEFCGTFFMVHGVYWAYS